MAQERFDAVVIGGGPAGSMAAMALAQAGWDTLLVERGPRGRPKACGDCLSPRGCGVLERQGLLEAVRRIAVGTTRDLRVHMARRDPLRVGEQSTGSPFRGRGLLVERASFDQLLVDAAQARGAAVIRPASARLLATGAGSATVEVADGRRRLRVSCALVVGADGLRSG